MRSPATICSDVDDIRILRIMCSKGTESDRRGYRGNLIGAVYGTSVVPVG